MMATQEKRIAGQTYSVTQLPAMTAYKLLNRLARVMAPGLSVVGTKAGTLGDMDLGEVATALPKMLEQLPEEEQERVTRLVLEPCLVDGAPLMPKFDLHFQGRPFVILQVVWFALQVNYGNFRDALAAAGIGRGKAETSLSEMLNTSAGQSNGSSRRESQPDET